MGSMNDAAETTRPTPRIDSPPVTEQPARVDVGTCPHPIESIRLDGIWKIDVPRASVTCEKCGGSFTLRVRSDLRAALLTGGVIA